MAMIDMSPEIVAIAMLTLLLTFIFLGYPLGFSLAGVAVGVGFLAFGTRVFNILYSQAYGILTNYILVAIPLFVFMGIMIEQSGIGKAVFDTLEIWLHRLRGHIAIVVVLTGTILAACVGIIAASVVMLGLVALPHMMARGYNKELATGVICAGGTLGILIPPSVMLVVYGPMAEISVGKLFMAAFGPGLTLSVLYITYIFVATSIKPGWAPSGHDETEKAIPLRTKIRLLFTSVVPIVVLVLTVLGSIFFGVAAPTEAAAVGAVAATLIAIARRGLSWFKLKEVVLGTAKVTGMIAVVAIGAIGFVGVFLALGGGEVVTNFVLAAPGGKWGVFIVIMIIIFILGMFIDWLGIIFIMVPLVTPIAEVLGFHELWFAMMICVNLQMAFMSPPFAVAIYFLRGVTPPEYGITTAHIIRGVIPFIVLVWIGIGLMVAFPQIVLWLPGVMIR
jgi:tripartite ATP-independent transporter DctM subunit